MRRRFNGAILFSLKIFYSLFILAHTKYTQYIHHHIVNICHFSFILHIHYMMKSNLGYIMNNKQGAWGKFPI